ncbi:MAG TPA: helix-turn-helix transcriptional regulator [Acidobacteriota bacterium]|nr:helix-turn-helix transcriptional regulator [Acidobacteriota bacterium]
MDLLKPGEAAAELGISLPTLKQWIYKGQIESITTAGGHHRIPRSEVQRLLKSHHSPSASSEPHVHTDSLVLGAISGRNKLAGTVIDVKIEGLLAQVTLDIGGQTITSIITRGSCEELGLKAGVRAYALIKATEVMMIRG